MQYLWTPRDIPAAVEFRVPGIKRADDRYPIFFPHKNGVVSLTSTLTPVPHAQNASLAPEVTDFEARCEAGLKDRTRTA